jgi:hypothetical protein
VGTFRAPRRSIDHDRDIPPLGADVGMTVPDTSEVAGGSYQFALALTPPELQHVALQLDGGVLSYLSRPNMEYFPGA